MWGEQRSGRGFRSALRGAKGGGIQRAGGGRKIHKLVTGAPSGRGGFGKQRGVVKTKTALRREALNARRHQNTAKIAGGGALWRKRRSKKERTSPKRGKNKKER